ncbi:MAG: acetyl-CoA carboxylase, carboxyltransferase subunit beta [Firmicutes bacterium]|nr:acetyl-CoA carboxylase, carboxyltransferase subunit beta [Bacillota bacterium]
MIKFRKPKNFLEGSRKLANAAQKGLTDDLVVCPKCKKSLENSDLIGRLNVCIYCGHHFRQTARQRLNFICDDGSLTELYADLQSENILDFPEYDKKLANAKLGSKEVDAVICGTCEINGVKSAIFAMEPYFMMGSMGVVVGEKITSLFEQATAERLPIVGFTVSGGARMQEGILSLMQMAKISGAVKRHSDSGQLYLCVLTDPTTGGVTASFAMQADVTIAEPNALIGFAGPRVIEQTIRKRLPDGFQEASFILEKGFVDDIVERKDLKDYIGRILRLHNYA